MALHCIASHQPGEEDMENISSAGGGQAFAFMDRERRGDRGKLPHGTAKEAHVITALSLIIIFLRRHGAGEVQDREYLVTIAEERKVIRSKDPDAN